MLNSAIGFTVAGFLVAVTGYFTYEAYLALQRTPYTRDTIELIGYYGNSVGVAVLLWIITLKVLQKTL